MESLPSTSHPTLYPNGIIESYLDPTRGEDSFRDPPILQHDGQPYSSDFVAALPTQNITTTPDADSSTQCPRSSFFRPSPESSILGETTPSHRTRRFIFAALVMAFYASTIVLTAAIVLIVRNATGSTNGRLRAIGVIMGLLGGTGVMTSGLAAWKTWRKQRRRARRKGARTQQEQMGFELELQGLMTKNEPLAFTPAVGLDPASDLAEVPLPLFDGRSQWGSNRGNGHLGCIDRTTIDAVGDHDNIAHEIFSAENEIGISAIEEDKRKDSNPDQRNTSPESPPTILSRNIIVPILFQNSSTRSQLLKHHHEPPPANQNLPPPTPPATTTTTSDEKPHASTAWPPHPAPSISSSTSTPTSSSSSSLSLPLQNPSSQDQPQYQYRHHPQDQDLSLLHALAADMGSDDESTRQTKRKLGLETARIWGAVDDDDDDDDGKKEGAEVGVTWWEKGGKEKGMGMGLEGGVEVGGEIEIEHGRRNGNGVGNANADANTNGKRWGRVWGRKRKDK